VLQTIRRLDFFDDLLDAIENSAFLNFLQISLETPAEYGFHALPSKELKDSVSIDLFGLPSLPDSFCQRHIFQHFSKNLVQ
jgi:hypothetical protein